MDLSSEPLAPRCCSSLPPAREHAEGRRSRQRKNTEFLRNAKTFRGLAFTRSRHPATMQRVLVFAFRQRKNTQRVSEGWRSHDHDTPRPRRGSSFLRFDNAKTRREGHRSCDHDTPRPRSESSFLRFDNLKARRGLAFFLFLAKCLASHQPYPALYNMLNYKF